MLGNQDGAKKWIDVEHNHVASTREAHEYFYSQVNTFYSFLKLFILIIFNLFFRSPRTILERSTTNTGWTLSFSATLPTISFNLDKENNFENYQKIPDFF